MHKTQMSIRCVNMTVVNLLYYQNYYFQYKQNMQSLTQIAQYFSKIYKQRYIHISHILPLLQAYFKLPQKGTLTQRITIISSLTYYFNSAIANQLPAIEKLKNNVYYGFLQSSHKKERRLPIIRTSHYARTRTRVEPEMTIDEILEHAVANGLNQMNNQDSLLPQKLEGMANAGMISVTVAPFQPEIIAQLTQAASNCEKSLDKSSQMSEWEPNKLQNYQRWLALTQNNISIIPKQKPSQTKKKNPRRKQCIKDEKIDISQQTDHLVLMERLETKIKRSRQQQNKYQCSLQQFFEGINPILMNVGSIRVPLALKLIQNKKKYAISYEKHHYDQVFLNSFDRTHNDLLNSSKLKPLSESHAKIDDLGEKMKKLIDEWLLLEKRITFQRLCQLRALAGKKKGEVFYHLLGCNFHLHQDDAPNFGRIYVCVKAQ